MRSLFEISEDLHFLSDFLTDAEGDVTDESLEAEIDSWLANLGAERDTKIDNYCALIKDFEAKAEARIANLGTIDNNSAARLKSRLHEFFKTHKIDKLETLRFKLARQKNGGGLPLILDLAMTEAPELIPEPYRKVAYFPDVAAIKEGLEAGEDIAWASLGERGEHLRIR